jgi:hypothetical protein
VHPRRTPPLAAVLALAIAGACTGPALHVNNPDGHVVFVDGTLVTTPSLPFRYYGRARCDALPKDHDGRADWDHMATSEHVDVRAPASPWLFPLDLPLELLARVANGRPDTTIDVAVRPRPADPRSEREFTNAESTAVAARARDARIAR